MLEQLKFVKGAVATKDFVPELTHFLIKDGYVNGYNGIVSLRTKIPLDMCVAPNAKQFVKAIDSCTEPPSIHVNKAGKLCIVSGKFRTFVNCVDSDKFPEFTPTGEVVELKHPLLPALQKLEPFIAQDASRPWACGILFKDKSAYATNNIVLLQYWLGYTFPQATSIPHPAVKELLRIGKEPVSIQCAENSMTFHYEDGSWLSTHLKKLEWPNLDPILDVQGNTQPFPEGFFEAVETCLPFVDDLTALHFHDGFVSTSANPEEDGTSVGVAHIRKGACFNAKQLKILSGIANSIDFSCYPKPCPFFGERIRGVIIGIRVQ